MLKLSVREVAATIQGMVLANRAVQVGFVASSSERARLTGMAVAELLKNSGAVWHPAYRQVRWPGGATATFLPGNDPDRLRGGRWVAAFAPPEVTSQKEVNAAIFCVVWGAGGTGSVLSSDEVGSRSALYELLREVA